ncbi:hypothetical protein CROQUDRAFT_663575 [Cronartium quercuum f. sp. fusiforme G11]|uniref:RNA polymerase III subunit C6 n=1 Tax=Cronartium quercuum f. sp. fusiforme G11 TaxID=708437 RepID=A0A9P6ND83_9BASI|nr:hypothetical protein CROQUDRAFT_663575 [Cronartium quercuum f. sp. fusiforme G11]
MAPKPKLTGSAQTTSSKITTTQSNGTAVKPPTASGSGATSGGTGQSKLSKDEKELFTKCVNAEQRTLSHEELQAAMPKLDVVEKMNVANSLIARGMLQVKRLQDELFYTAVDKTQQKTNSSMNLDEKLVYDSIASAGNTGLWTKTLKARTNIHQSNIVKILKSLEGKNLIKSVKSVKFPTRKIYMLSELQPSIELSGGPWYTDNELDTEFIGVLLRSIHKCLQDRSHPPVSSSAADPCKVLLYPTSHAPYLPTTVHDVLDYLKQTQIIQEGTDLTTDHILTLIDVLLYDGVIERITVGTAKCEGQDEFEDGRLVKSEDSDSELEDDPFSSTSRKRKSDKISKSKKKNSLSKPNKRLRYDEDMDLDPENEPNSGSEEEDEDNKSAIKSLTKSRRRRILPDNEPFVYRVLQPLMEQRDEDEEDEIEEERGLDTNLIGPPPKVSGFFDMPCGHCPSFDFCSSKGKAWQFRGNSILSKNQGDNLQRLPRIGLAGIGAGFSSLGGLGAGGGVAPVNPAECVYFNDWLDF